MGRRCPLVREGRRQIPVPVVAAQGPVEHHQTPGQAAVGEGGFQAEAVAGPRKRCRQLRVKRARARARGQLPHHHPGGRLHRVLPEERIPLQRLLGRGAGFTPAFTGLPAKTEGSPSEWKEIAPVTAVDHHRRGEARHPALPGALLEALHQGRHNPALATLQGTNASPGPPPQARLRGHPAAQDRFRGGGPVAEAADPVLVEAPGRLRRQSPQQGPPQTGLPRAELIAIGAADPRRTHHSPQPVAGGEKQGRGPTAGGLQSRRHPTAPPSPHQHLWIRAAVAHGLDLHTGGPVSRLPHPR